MVQYYKPWLWSDDDTNTPWYSINHDTKTPWYNINHDTQTMVQYKPWHKHTMVQHKPWHKTPWYSINHDTKHTMIMMIQAKPLLPVYYNGVTQNSVKMVTLLMMMNEKRESLICLILPSHCHQIISQIVTNHSMMTPLHWPASRLPCSRISYRLLCNRLADTPDRNWICPGSLVTSDWPTPTCLPGCPACGEFSWRGCLHCIWKRRKGKEIENLTTPKKQACT